ncbi:hypothetical protein ACLI4Z_01490 [Natrialbaceae archaeon A-arb3/5]
MSREEIAHRSMADNEFAAAVRTDPSTALESYDCSDEEIEAIESGDEAKIRSALGLEYDAGVPNQGPPRRN